MNVMRRRDGQCFKVNDVMHHNGKIVAYDCERIVDGVIYTELILPADEVAIMA